MKISAAKDAILLRRLAPLAVVFCLIASPAPGGDLEALGLRPSLPASFESGHEASLSGLETLALAPSSRPEEPSAKPSASAPDLFGSVAVRMAPLAISPRWKEILAEDASRFLVGKCSASKPICSSAGLPHWREAVRRGATKPLRAQLDFVNSRVNAMVRYASDQEIYGSADHWATLSETVMNGAGDCEDIAIAKMWMLNALGVPLDRMQVVAIKDRRRGVDHAVLTVSQGGRSYILDNVHDQVLEHRDVGHYQPIFSVSSAGSWVHGYRRRPDRLSSSEQANAGR